MDRNCRSPAGVRHRGKGEDQLHQVHDPRAAFRARRDEGDLARSHKMRADVCDFSLDWPPARAFTTTRAPRLLTQRMVIEAVTGRLPRRESGKMCFPRSCSPRPFLSAPAESSRSVADTTRLSSRHFCLRSSQRRMPRAAAMRLARGMAAGFYQMLLAAAARGMYGFVPASAGELRDAQPHRRPRRRLMGGHSDAPWGPARMSARQRPIRCLGIYRVVRRHFWHCRRGHLIFWPTRLAGVSPISPLRQ